MYLLSKPREIKTSAFSKFMRANIKVKTKIFFLTDKHATEEIRVKPFSVKIYKYLSVQIALLLIQFLFFIEMGKETLHKSH